MRERFKAMKARWENEKNAIGKVQKLREDLEAANAQLEKAQREYDLEKAAQLQYGTIPDLKKQLEEQGLCRPVQGGQPAPGQGHRGGDRPDCGAVDRHPCGKAHGG